MGKFIAMVALLIITVSLQGCGTLYDTKIDGVVLTLEDKQSWKPDNNIINEFEEGLVSYVF